MPRFRHCVHAFLCTAQDAAEGDGSFVQENDVVSLISEQDWDLHVSRPAGLAPPGRLLQRRRLACLRS